MPTESGTTSDPSTGAKPMVPERWKALIEQAQVHGPPVVVATTFISRLASGSKPIKFLCDDRRVHLAKTVQNGHNFGVAGGLRSLVTEQVAGRLGSAMNAPVPETSLVNVPKELLAAEPTLQDVVPGLAHGSVWMDGFSDREMLNHIDTNRARFAALALFYGWLFCSADHQFIYRNSSPHDVLSVDHGLFLPGQYNWTVASLAGGAPQQPDALIVAGCNLAADELRAACGGLLRVSDETIARAVATPAESWGITMDERVTFAEYAASRRDALLKKYGLLS